MPQSVSASVGRVEYAERLDAVRARMREQELAGLLVFGPEDIYYLTGFRSMGHFTFQALIITPAEEPMMMARNLERRMYLANSWAQGYHGYGDDQDPVERLRVLLSEVGLGRGRVGISKRSPSLNAAAFEALAMAAPDVEWVDTSAMVASLRSVKSPTEIALITGAAEVTGYAMRRAIDAVSEGATENDVAAAFLGEAISRGSENPASGPLVGSGPRSAFGHASWENRTLERNDVVFIEGGACIGRYHAGLMRTVCVGPANDTARRFADASRAGLHAAESALRPGRTSGEVDAACRAAVADAGAGDNFRHRAGYSIGIGFTTWIDGFSIRPSDSTPIRPNMVIHIVPFLSDDAMGVALSQTYLVTDTDARALVDVPAILVET